MKKYLLFSGLLALFAATPVFALRFESGENIRITQPVNEDIYVFAGNITIEAPVNGDIWCAGGTVTIRDTVYGDLVAAGGTIYLKGAVLDDVRAAGGTLTLSGNIGGDLLVTGGTVMVESNAVVNGSVLASGGSITFDGKTEGFLKIAGGEFALNGSVGRNFEFNGGNLTLNGTVGGSSVVVAQRITLGDQAALKGNVRYWTDNGEVNFGSALTDGASASFDTSLREQFQRPEFKFLGFASFLMVFWYLCAMFILLWLGQWIFGRVVHEAAAKAGSEPVRSLGYGFLYFAAVPVAIVLLLITLVGIPVGLIILFFYLLFLALAHLITALVGAHWIARYRAKEWRPIHLVLVALGLLVALKLLVAIPFVGWIASVAAVFIAFGAILDNTGLFRRRQVA
jgi:cytoskeletal protein CcmA (bactofilin family)